MNDIIGVDAAKLAGLQIDLLQKVRSKQITIGQLEKFLNLPKEKRNIALSDFVLNADKAPSVISVEQDTFFDEMRNYFPPPVKLEEHGTRLDTIDINKIQLVHMLKPGEKCIKGYEMMERLKNAGHNLLNFDVFRVLFKNRDLIPASWKQTGDREISVFFNGTIVRSGNGHRYIFALTFLPFLTGGTGWCYGPKDLKEKYYANDLSATLSF